MERRRALVVAGAVTISALAGATAVGASTGLLGFGGAKVEPTPAVATDPPATESQIVRLPGQVVPSSAPGPDVTIPAPAARRGGAVTVAGTESEPTTTVEPPHGYEPGEREVERPESPEPARHETGD